MAVMHPKSIVDAFPVYGRVPRQTHHTLYNIFPLPAGLLFIIIPTLLRTHRSRSPRRVAPSTGVFRQQWRHPYTTVYVIVSVGSAIFPFR